MLETVAICMSELQDQFDKGLITAAEFNARWDEEMEENERLHPGIHARMHAHLLADEHLLDRRLKQVEQSILEQDRVRRR